MNTKVSATNTLDTFIAESRARLKNILQRLEWDAEKTLCLKFAKICDKRSEELPTDLEPELPPSCATSNSLVTDVERLKQIVEDNSKEVPKTFSELQLNFTRQQKLAIYEHVVANTVKRTEPEITVPALGENALTFAEIVARKKRESKKRRRYRQSKPTHTEEVRAVVDLQMQALQQYLSTKEQLEQHNTENKTYKGERRLWQQPLNTKVQQHKSDKKIFEGERHELQQVLVRKVDNKLEGKPCKSDSHRNDIKHKDKKTYQRRSREAEKSYGHHSRSKSHDRIGSKSTRHRSRSTSRSHKSKHHQERIRHRSKSRERQHHKYRSRSRERKYHKNRSRSRSRDKRRSYNSCRQSRSSSRRSSSRKRSFSRRSRSRSHSRRNTSIRKT